MCRPYGWVFGPKFSRQGSLSRHIFHKYGWVIGEKWPKIGCYPPKFIIKIGMAASFGSKKRVPF